MILVKRAFGGIKTIHHARVFKNVNSTVLWSMLIRVENASFLD